ncbi:MAG: GTPase RsgA [Nanoarchaeota archaeon]|nr:GTPase RsgA [Nanoarchaeota archaeon]
MVIYWNLVNRVIDEAEILLLVIDARMPDDTRHREIESKVLQRGKVLLYVLNKCDLVEKHVIEALKKEFNPAVFVSSKQRLGGTILFKKIMEISKGKNCVVGVLGYPNVGKSSVINLLKGEKAAPVSPTSGYTKSIQFVRAKGKIKLIDTPGVLPFDDADLFKKVLVGSKNPEHLKEPEMFAMLLIEKFPDMFSRYYDLKYEGDAYDFVDAAAQKRRILSKGGSSDIPRFSRQLLYDWQRGRVHEFNLSTHQKSS